MNSVVKLLLKWSDDCVIADTTKCWMTDTIGDSFHVCPYSVRMRENAGKMQTRMTPNTDSF